MGLLDFLRKTEAETKPPDTSCQVRLFNPSTQSVANINDPHFWSGGAAGSKDPLELAEKYTWAAVCCQIIADAVAAASMEVVDNSGTPVDKRRLPSDVRLLIDTNEADQTLADVVRVGVMHVLSHGNAYLYPHQTTAAGIDAILPLDPRMVTAPTIATPAQDRVYAVGSKRMGPESIVHLRQYWVDDPYRGISVLGAMLTDINNDRRTVEVANKYLDSGGLPPFLLIENMGGSVSAAPDGYAARKTSELRSLLFNGASVSSRQAQGAWIATANGAQAVFPPFDLGAIRALDGRKWVKEEVFSAYRVPMILASYSDGAPRATAEYQIAQFYASTVNPRIQYVESALNAQLFARLAGGKYRLKYRLYQTEDAESLKWKISYGLITPARAAEIIGEPVPDVKLEPEAHRRYILSTLVPLADAGMGLAPTGIPAQAVEKKLTRESQAVRRSKRRALWHSKIEAGIAQATAGMAADLKAAFIMDGIERAAEFEMTKQAIGVKLGAVAAAIKKRAEQVEATAIEVTEGIAGRPVDGAFKTMAHNAVLTAFEMQLDFISQTTSTGISEMVKTMQDDNAGISEITRAIISKYEDYGAERAETIARTVGRACWDAAAIPAYQGLGVAAVDVYGCVAFEADSDCGAENVPIDQIANLSFHPNHTGSLVPVLEDMPQ